MKKVLLSMAVCALSFEMADGMLERYNPDSRAVVRRDISGSDVVVRSDTGNQDLVVQEESALAQQVDVRQILQPTLDGETVTVCIRDCRDGKLIKEWFKEYPLIRKFLGYEHDFEKGKSYPVLKLFADVRDIEHADELEAIVDPEFEDEANALLHQRRETGQYKMDDTNLRAIPGTEIFIRTKEGDEVIDSSKFRSDTPFVLYTKVPTSARIEKIGVPTTKPGDDEYEYQRTETFEDWRRPDGTIFTKRTEGVQKIARSKPSEPVQSQPITVTIPVHHWNKGSMFRGGHWDWNVRQETVTVYPGQRVPTAIKLNSDWSFGEYWY